MSRPFSKPDVFSPPMLFLVRSCKVAETKKIVLFLSQRVHRTTRPGASVIYSKKKQHQFLQFHPEGLTQNDLFHEPFDTRFGPGYPCIPGGTMNATIQRWGKSQGIRIPKSILASLNLKSGSQVTLDVKGNTVIMKLVLPPKKTRNDRIRDLLKDWPKPYRPGEMFRESPKGSEAW